MVPAICAGWKRHCALRLGIQGVSLHSYRYAWAELNIMEGSRSLRPEVLTTLVKNCRRVKVVRLCVNWAEELNLPWAAPAKKVAGKSLSSGRWTTRLKDGTLLVLKP